MRMKYLSCTPDWLFDTSYKVRKLLKVPSASRQVYHLDDRTETGRIWILYLSGKSIVKQLSSDVTHYQELLDFIDLRQAQLRIQKVAAANDEQKKEKTCHSI